MIISYIKLIYLKFIHILITINLSKNFLGGGSFEINIIGQHILLSTNVQYFALILICLAYSIVLVLEYKTYQF